MTFDPAAAFDPETFRRQGREVIDWIADYWQSIESRPVTSQVEPGWVRSQLPPAPPEQPETLEAVLSDLNRVVVPGLTHWQHPSFFAYFPANASGPAILGELLSAGLGVQGMLWTTSPACTELETHVLDWLCSLLGLPDRFGSTTGGGGAIYDTASSGLLCAMVAARERATQLESNARGMQQSNRSMIVYASEAAHSSVEKAAKISGIGQQWVRTIGLNTRGEMDPLALARAMDDDALAGHTPCFVAATVGTTACGAFDQVPRIAESSLRHGAWLHVDAAWAGAAAICPDYRPRIIAGAEHADSWGFNPHKWMLVNFDCHALWVADRKSLVEALTIKPEYLRNNASEGGGVIDYSDWQVPLGRRFRALKLWLTLRMIGTESLRQRICDHVAWAADFAGWVEADPRFDLVCPPSLSLVCFAMRQGDRASAKLLDRVNRQGNMSLSHARVAGRYCLRLAIGGTMTQRQHVEAAWETLTSLATIEERATP